MVESNQDIGAEAPNWCHNVIDVEASLLSLFIKLWLRVAKVKVRRLKMGITM